MKKYLSKILASATILTLGVLIFVPQVAGANVVTTLATGATTGFVHETIANFANWILAATSNLLAISGVFLSVAINLTTHIKDIYEKIPGLESVWITVRDISSMLIIFYLLYFSIKKIVGLDDTGVNKLIVNIFIAGVFINFSLFFTKVLIDGSNIISLQFYRAIAPETSQNWTVGQAFNSGGISNVFMNSLKIPKIYNNNNLKSTDAMASIGFAAVGGIIIMVVTMISFLAAAIAFTARTAILLFCMALSPLYFVGMIFPEVEEKVSKKIMGLFTDQLIFMPVYLFLLYVALRFISDDGFMAVFNPRGAVQDSSAISSTSIGVVVQYAIAMIFINAPLVAAIAMGGMGMKWAPGSSGVNAVNSWIGGKVGGLVGRNTLGLTGKGLGKAFDNVAASAQNNKYGRGASTVLRTLGVSQAVRGGLSGMEKGKYGGSQNLEDIKKEDKERSRFVSGVQRSNAQMAIIESVTTKGLSPTIQQMSDFADTVGKMSKKELEETEFKKLSNENFITKISSKSFDSLIEGDSITEQQKNELKDIRKKAIIKDLSLGIPDVTKDLMKNLSGKELAKLGNDASGNPILQKGSVIDYLNPGHLKEMEDTLDRPTKRKIGDYIASRPAATTEHKAFGFMQNPRNRTNWS
jgi:hypothetical protein